ncbi:MAG: AI-2E family transporter [Bacteroidetes bacterium]|nr:AI-2E family transporter [Bacteroidota bacterium]MDA1121399.1 AI-2E family transporter [Bacteroidota bacterium]
MALRWTIYSLIFTISLIFLGWYFANILLYLIISITLATILRPLTNSLARLHFLGAHVPRIVAILLSFVVVVGFFAMFIVLFIPLVSDQVSVLSRINYDKVLETVSGPLVGIENFLLENNLVQGSSGIIVKTLRENFLDILGRINFSEIINDLVSFTGNFFVGMLATGFITFFLLYENGLLRNQIINVVPNQYFELFISALFKIEKLLSNYLLGLLLQMFSIFSIAAIGLSILGIKYVLTIALFAAFANLIPYLGPMLGAIFGMIVGLSTGGDALVSYASILLMVKILTVFAVVQATDNIVLQPLIFSKSVRAHPLEIFVIIFAGANIAGITGMIAAIPVYTILRVSTIEIMGGFRKYQIFKV